MTLIVNRKGEFVESSADDKHLPISVKYLQRVIEHMKPNKALYIDCELSKRDARTLQTMVCMAKKVVGANVSTFKTNRGDRVILGIIKVDVNEGNTIV